MASVVGLLRLGQRLDLLPDAVQPGLEHERTGRHTSNATRDLARRTDLSAFLEIDRVQLPIARDLDLSLAALALVRSCGFSSTRSSSLAISQLVR